MNCLFLFFSLISFALSVSASNFKIIVKYYDQGDLSCMSDDIGATPKYFDGSGLPISSDDHRVALYKKNMQSPSDEKSKKEILSPMKKSSQGNLVSSFSTATQKFLNDGFRENTERESEDLHFDYDDQSTDTFMENFCTPKKKKNEVERDISVSPVDLKSLIQKVKSKSKNQKRRNSEEGAQDDNAKKKYKNENNLNRETKKWRFVLPKQKNMPKKTKNRFQTRHLNSEEIDSSSDDKNKK